MPNEDSSRPGFWNSRFKMGKTPWDFHGVPERLKKYLGESSPGRALIPGCGSAYEVREFLKAGWNVTAIDFSEAAVVRAKQILGPWGAHVVFGDFFKFPFQANAFDLIYERTFLCALPPTFWPDYAKRMSELLRPHGKLVGYFLYGEEPEPPPYPLTKGTATELFERAFRLINDEAVADSLTIFEGKERWQEWERV
jgi:hypothetical protein